MGTVEADLVLDTGTLSPNVIEEQTLAAFNFAEMKSATTCLHAEP
jgi:hypothetical protein